MHTITVAVVGDVFLSSAVVELLGREDDVRVVAVGTAPDTIPGLVRRHRPDVLLVAWAGGPAAGLARVLAGVRRASPGLGVVGCGRSADGVPGPVPATYHQLLTQVRAAAPGAAAGPANRTGALSPREVDVVGLVSQGLSNHQIARRLQIAEGTVKRHLRGVFDKLDARSRLEATNKAVARGVIRPPAPVH